MKYLSIIMSIIMLGLFLPSNLNAQADVDQFEVQVDGLGCPFCAYGLEKKFKEFKQIKDVKIEIETGVMTFKYPSSEMLTTTQVEDQVDAAGYTAVKIKIERADGSMQESVATVQQSFNEDELTSTSFFVAGNCGMCEARIEKTARSIKGVAEAEWNKKTNMLELRFDKSLTTQKAIETAIAKSGHDTHDSKADDAVYKSLPGCCQYDRIK